MDKQKKIIKFAVLNFGTILSAIGIHFFRLPNNFSAGGAAGIGVVLGELFPSIAAGTYTAVLNLLFVALGFVFLGKNFGWQSIYCSLLFSGLLQLMELIVPLETPLTNQRMLELIFASTIPAVSSAVLFNYGASTGGTEVIALIMKKYTVLDAGRALLCVDILFTASTFFIFDIETGMYSSLGLFVKAIFIDSFMEEIQRKKAMFIITTSPTTVVKYIIREVHRSATVWEAKGAFTDEKRWVVLAVINGVQAMKLRSYLRIYDPGAFILSENSSEIYGKGFRKL